MIGEVIVVFVLILPLVLGLLLRVSTPHLFFSVMSGELIGRYFGHDLEHFLQPFMTDVDITGYGEVALIIIPILLTAFFLRKTIPTGRLVLHILPLAITGIVLAAFVLPILPAALKSEVVVYEPGFWLLGLNKAIIGGVIVLQLIALWIFNHHELTSKRSKS